MKKIAGLLCVVLVISSLMVPTYAVETEDNELIVYFVDKLIAMENKEMYVELLEMAVNLDDANGMLVAYGNAFSSLTGAQQEALQDMELIMDQMSRLADNVFKYKSDVANLKDYLGIIDSSINRDKLLQVLGNKEEAFLEFSEGITTEVFDRGFELIDLMFELIGDLEDFRSSGLLSEDAFMFEEDVNGSLSVNTEMIDLAALAVYARTGTRVEDTTPLIEAAGQLTDYYNGLSMLEKELVFNYFDKYNLVGEYAGVTGNTTSSSVGSETVSSGNTEISNTSYEFEDEFVAAADVLFIDINHVPWAFTAIRQLYIADIIKGKGNGIYDPDGDITRAEFSALLVRMLEVEIPEDTEELEAIFSDVNSDKWYYGEVMAAYEAGYIQGVGGGLFEPSSTINREQIAAILGRVLTDAGVDELTESEINELLSEFYDVDEVSLWAEDGAALLVKHQIVSGVGNAIGSLSYGFKMDASRAEVAVMLYELSKSVNTKVMTVD